MILKIGNKPYELATKEEVMKEVIKEMEATKKEVFDKLYPVGSVYISLDATFNPNNIYNGKWELLEKGRYLRATDEIDKVGQKVDEALPNPKPVDLFSHIRILETNCQNELVIPPNSFSSINYATDANAGQVPNYYGRGFHFDLSLLSKVYQNGAKVTPKSIDAFIWKRIE